jgi:hypothetical protein
MALQFCPVCGRASQRASWSKTGNVNGTSYVACDFHSDALIVTAILDMGGVPANTQVLAAQNGKQRKTIHDTGGA